MHRPYTKEKIIQTFNMLKSISSPLACPPNRRVKEGTEGRLTFSTDIIVGFPTETDADFQETYDLCRQIGLSHIHVFKYSPRPETSGRELFLKSEKIGKPTLLERSKKIRSLVLE